MKHNLNLQDKKTAKEILKKLESTRNKLDDICDDVEDTIEGDLFDMNPIIDTKKIEANVEGYMSELSRCYKELKTIFYTENTEG
jgi:hypothetical protein